MTRRFMMLAALALFLSSAVPAMAHDDYRIIGTIAKVTPKLLDVKQKRDGKIITMDILAESIVTRDGKKVGLAELKAGLSVVVDARGDSIEELEIVEVKIVPPARSK
jgi:hypothetical protein